MIESAPALPDIFRRLEETASWDGITLAALDQRNHLDDTPLHTVCTWGDEKSARALIVAGADVNARGDKGATPLFNAVMGKSMAVLTLLLESGADAAMVNDWGDTPGDFARMTALGSGPSLAKTLLGLADTLQRTSR